MKVEGSPYRRLVPALRISARHRLSSVTGPEAHATTLLTSTASGWPLWISLSTRSLQQRRSKQASSCRASAAARSAWRTYERLLQWRRHQMERRIDSRGSFCLFTQYIIRNMKSLQYHDILLKRPTEEKVPRWRLLNDKNMNCSVKCGLVLTFNLLPQLLYISNHTYSWTKDPLLHRHCHYFGSTTQLKPTNTSCQHKQNVFRGHVNINRIIFL